MLKKSLVTLVAILMVVVFAAGCSTPAADTAASSAAPASEAASASEAAPASSEAATAEAPAYTPAADIQAPAGKTLLSLPVDQVAEKELKIASIMVQNNPFGVAVLQGSQFANEALKGRNAVVDSISVEDFDAQKWTSVVENCIAAKYDAICLLGLSEALTPVVNKAVDAGIIVMAFNTEPGLDSKRTAFYGQDGDYGGKQCGKALEELMGGEGEYIIITGDFGVLGHELRRKGARSVLDANSKLKLVGEFENNDKAEEAYNITTNAMLANPNLKGIYVTAGGPSGAAKALEDAGKQNDIMMVCHDVLAEAAPYVADGTIKACLDQDPFNQGYQPCIDAFNMLVTGKAPAQEINWYEGVMATPETVKDLFPELFQ